MNFTVLIVEGVRATRTSLSKALLGLGHQVIETSDLNEARRILAERPVDLVLPGMALLDGSGLELLRHGVGRNYAAPKIIITGNPEMESAMLAAKQGACDFLPWPMDSRRLRSRIRRALGAIEVARGSSRLPEVGSVGACPIIGASEEILRVLREADRAAGTEASVLLVGERGTGKELLARRIHRRSPRAGGPFVAFNCARLCGETIQTTLFGHVRGAFTGAQKGHKGLFEQAGGGTLLLDEISSMREESQNFLLRATEGHPFRRLGSEQDIRLDFRLIAATNRNPDGPPEGDGMRPDLIDRLSVFRIDLPPLRAREHDCILLAEYFLEEISIERGKKRPRLEEEVRAAFRAYPWPGNVREIRNMMVNLVEMFPGGRIGVDDLPKHFRRKLTRVHDPGITAPPKPLADVDHNHAIWRFKANERNLSRTARELGISRPRLRRLLGLDKKPKRKRPSSSRRRPPHPEGMHKDRSR